MSYILLCYKYLSVQEMCCLDLRTKDKAKANDRLFQRGLGSTFSVCVWELEIEIERERD